MHVQWRFSRRHVVKKRFWYKLSSRLPYTTSIQDMLTLMTQKFFENTEETFYLQDQYQSMELSVDDPWFHHFKKEKYRWLNSNTEKWVCNFHVNYKSIIFVNFILTMFNDIWKSQNHRCRAFLKQSLSMVLNINMHGFKTLSWVGDF